MSTSLTTADLAWTLKHHSLRFRIPGGKNLEKSHSVIDTTSKTQESV